LAYHKRVYIKAVPNMQILQIGTAFDYYIEEKRKKSYINKKLYIMNIKPLADRVLVKPVAAEEKTAAGIIIPDTAKEKPLKGQVLAIGNGTKDEEMVVKVGDTVLYGKYAGTELELDGDKYLIMRQSDILAVIG
jgi:chaperonin GroES